MVSKIIKDELTSFEKIKDFLSLSHTEKKFYGHKYSYHKKSYNLNDLIRFINQRALESLDGSIEKKQDLKQNLSSILKKISTFQDLEAMNSSFFKKMMDRLIGVVKKIFFKIQKDPLEDLRKLDEKLRGEVTGIQSFPKETQHEILKYLDPLSLTQLSGTNRYFKDLIDSEKKFKTKTFNHREVMPIKTAILFLQQELEEDEENNGSKKIEEILKRFLFLLPYLAESNPIFTLKLIDSCYGIQVQKALSEDHKDHFFCIPHVSDDIRSPFYFLLTGLANLDNQEMFLKVLMRDPEKQALTLLRVATIQLETNPFQSLLQIRRAQEAQKFHEPKHDISFFLCTYARLISKIDYKQAETILREVKDASYHVYMAADLALYSNPAFRLEKGLNLPENTDNFRNSVKTINTKLIKNYDGISTHLYIHVFKNFLKVFDVTVNNSSVENVKKLIQMASENPIFLIDFLYEVDPQFFKAHSEWISCILESLDLKAISSNYLFKIIVFKIRSQLLTHLEDLESYGFSQHQNSIFSLELLKNDVNQIQKLIKKDMNDFEYSLLLIGFKIVSKVNMDFAYEFLETCELPNDNKIHIRALLADISKRKRLNLLEIDSEFYVNETFNYIERTACGYLPYNYS